MFFLVLLNKTKHEFVFCLLISQRTCNHKKLLNIDNASRASRRLAYLVLGSLRDNYSHQTHTYMYMNLFI